MWGRRDAENNYVGAYSEGFKDGFQAAKARWRQQVDNMAKSALKQLSEKYAVSIKVIEEEVTSTELDYLKKTDYEKYELVKLPAMAIRIVVDPNHEYCWVKRGKRDGGPGDIEP